MEETLETYLRQQIALVKKIRQQYHTQGEESLVEACNVRLDDLMAQLNHARAE